MLCWIALLRRIPRVWSETQVQHLTAASADEPWYHQCTSPCISDSLSTQPGPDSPAIGALHTRSSSHPHSIQPSLSPDSASSPRRVDAWLWRRLKLTRLGPLTTTAIATSNATLPTYSPHTHHHPAMASQRSTQYSAAPRFSGTPRFTVAPRLTVTPQSQPGPSRSHASASGPSPPVSRATQLGLGLASRGPSSSSSTSRGFAFGRGAAGLGKAGLGGKGKGALKRHV